MNAARFNQDEALYAAVRHYLKNTAADLTSAHRTSIAIKAALATVHSAVADFTEEWNSTAPSIMSVPSLPIELVVECFKRLSFRERVTASKVSRSWRAAIVGTPVFWSSINTPYLNQETRGRGAIARFRHMSSRSGSVPLDVYWYLITAGDLDDALRGEVYGLFRESMWRIRSLVAQDTPDMGFLTSLQAPALESLKLSDRSPLCIPAQWINSCAPHLRSLHVDSFTLPADSEICPLRNIEDFEGAIQRYSTGGPASGVQSIFALFPCIVSLKLMGINSVDELPLLVTPSLRNLDLRARNVVDFSPVLNNWSRPTLGPGEKRAFRFDSEGPPALNAALRHVATAHPSGPKSVSLKFDWSASVTFSSSGEYDVDITLTAVHDKYITTTHDLRGNPYLSLIRSVSLSGPSLIAFLRAELDLPALQTLSIKDYPTNSYKNDSAIYIALRRALPPLMAGPSLQEITFNLSPVLTTRHRYSDSDGGTAALLADFLATRVHWPAQTFHRRAGGLASILIVQPKPPAWDIVSGLRAFTSKIYYEASVDRTRIELSPPPPPPQKTQHQVEEWDEEGLKCLVPLTSTVKDE